MPEHERSTDSGGTTINEGTRFDLKTMFLAVSGALAVAGAVSRSEIAMIRMDSDLRAEIIAVKTEAEKNRADTENRIENIEFTVCAIARKMDVPSNGCPR